MSTPGGAGDTGTPTSTLMPRQLTPKQLALQEARKRKAEADRGVIDEFSCYIPVTIVGNGY